TRPAAAGFFARPLWLIGRLSIGRQLQMLTAALILLLVADAAIVAYDTRQSTIGTMYIATVGKIRMLSQRLAKAAQQASQGNAAAPALQELADEISALSVQTGGSARQNGITAQLMMLTQRMAKNANTMLAEAVVDPEVAFLLGKDTNTYRHTLQGLLQGSET